MTFGNKIDLPSAPAFDHENRKANLNTFYAPPIAPPAPSSTPRSRSRTCRRSSRSAITSRPDAMTYVLGRPRLQGGRLQSRVAARERRVRRGARLARRGRREEPVGRTPRDGQRRGVLDRLDRSAAERAEPVRSGTVLHCQRRVGARSSGVEVEVNGRARDGVDVFASVGYTHARFGADSFSSGVDVSGKTIPNTPDYTAILGTRAVAPAAFRPAGLRTRRSRLLRPALVRRIEHARAGRLSSRELPRRRARQVRVRRSLGQECVRHALHSGGLRVRPVRAVGLRRRERPAENVRPQGRRLILIGPRLLCAFGRHKEPAGDGHVPEHEAHDDTKITKDLRF